ncbi:MAG: hypothetical protein ABEJ99_04290, partial [Candidatus Nanohaloarchaea archaeon]
QKVSDFRVIYEEPSPGLFESLVGDGEGLFLRGIPIPEKNNPSLIAGFLLLKLVLGTRSTLWKYT